MRFWNVRGQSDPSVKAHAQNSDQICQLAPTLGTSCPCQIALKHVRRCVGRFDCIRAACTQSSVHLQVISCTACTYSFESRRIYPRSQNSQTRLSVVGGRRDLKEGQRLHLHYDFHTHISRGSSPLDVNVLSSLHVVVLETRSDSESVGWGRVSVGPGYWRSSERDAQCRE